MTEEIISSLPEVLKNCISTIKRTSKDETNSVYMSESLLKVINFDKIPLNYAKGKGWSGIPKSNDALYISNDKWYFIEFKNGSINKADIYRKIYDSLIMLIELGVIQNLQYSREIINYILVYNSDKYPNIQKSVSRDRGYQYFLDLANQEQKLFDVEDFEGYLFNEVHTYTKELFEKKFISVMESKEQNGIE